MEKEGKEFASRVGGWQSFNSGNQFNFCIVFTILFTIINDFPDFVLIKLVRNGIRIQMYVSMRNANIANKCFIGSKLNKNVLLSWV